MKGRPRTVDMTGKQSANKTLSVKVTTNQLNKLKTIADSKGVTVGELVRGILFVSTGI